MNDEMAKEVVPTPTQSNGEPLHDNGRGVPKEDGLDIPEFLRRELDLPAPAEEAKEVGGGEATEGDACSV